MKKISFVLLLALCAAPALFAQGPRQYTPQPGPVMVAPPPGVAEHPGPPPSRDSAWIAGYQRWDGHAYAWVPGHYDRRPRPRAVWVPHHWQHRHGGWVFVEGHWR